MSDIEWTDETWTPFRAWGNEREAVGWACEKVSEGCQHCYAETINRRLGTGLPYSVKAVEKSGGQHYLDEKALLTPLSWKKPRRIFVSSMTDIFGEWVPFDWLDRVFAVMALSPQHVFQVLTKRPERMREYANDERRRANVERAMREFRPEPPPRHWYHAPLNHAPWPLPNAWLGTSVELQRWADVRIPELLATPAAVRFLSCEPLLGPLDLTAIDKTHETDPGFNALDSTDEEGPLGDATIDWVIVGGESGPGARPFDLAWARSLVAQCRAAGVAVFVKQLGAVAYDDGPMCGWPVALDWNHPIGSTYRLNLKSRKGGDMAEWPEDLRVREWPA